MIINTAGTQAVSSLGWIDRAALWVYESEQSSPRKVVLSDAKWLHVRPGTSDFFAVVHHWDGNKLEISAHSHSEVIRVLSRISFDSSSKFSQPAVTLEGERYVWEWLPHAFTAFAFGDYRLILTNDRGDVELRGFEWFDDSYDKGYQGIIGVTEVPNSSLLVVSIQRDSTPVLYDPVNKQIVRKLKLADRGGNPEFHLRAAAGEFWVSDYDSIVKLSAKTLDVILAQRIQSAAPNGTAQFIGEFCFNLDESLCLVARPFSGDAIVLESESMRPTQRIELGEMPIDIGWLADGTVVARGWKTGEFMSHRL